MSSILSILNAPWAIEPQRLQALVEIYERRMASAELDVAAIEASTGKKLDNPPQGYTITDGVAVVPLRGVLAKRANLFQAISGGASHELFARDITAALNDSRVDAILVEADSPGGTVDGTPLAAAAVRAVRGIKPIATLADSNMASAALWIGVQADEVFASDAVTGVGSIGVVATHVDTSGAEAQRGLKVTELVAGRYKRIASTHAPLTEEGQAAIQSKLDAIYAEFVDAVAQARGATVDKVLADMADGRMFLAKEAMKAGLIDGIKSRAEVIGRLRNRVANTRRRVGLVSTRPISAVKEESTLMAPVQLLTADASALPHNDLVAAIEGAHPQLAQAFRAQGAAAERQRAADVRSQLMPGHEALIESLVADGKTTGPEAAVAVLNAERAMVAARASALKKDTPPPLPADPTATGVPAPAAQPKAGSQAEAMEQANRVALQIANKQSEMAKLGRTVDPVEALRLIEQEQQ